VEADWAAGETADTGHPSPQLREPNVDYRKYTAAVLAAVRHGSSDRVELGRLC
jgi:hypothetical protein